MQDGVCGAGPGFNKAKDQDEVTRELILDLGVLDLG